MQRLRVLWAIISIGLLSACAPEQTRFSASFGKLDLVEWQQCGHRIVPLRGQWSYYPGQLLSPDVFTGEPGLIEAEAQTIIVPGVWPGSGYATYRLVVKLAASRDNLALKIKTVSTAFIVWVNGRRIGEAGKVGHAADKARPEYRPQVMPIGSMETGTLDIVIQVSNFDYRSGGLWENFDLGSFDDLVLDKWRGDAKSILLASVLAAMALFHIALYLMRRQDRQFLYMALLTSSLALRALVTGEYSLVKLLPGTPFDIVIRLEYLSIILALPSAHYLYMEIFPSEYPSWLPKLSLGVSLVYGFFVLIFPPAIFTHTFYGYFIFALLNIAGIVAITFVAFLKKQQGALILLSAALVMLLGAISDNLSSNFAIYTGDWLVWGMVYFTFCQAIVLSLRLTRTFSQVESLSQELEGRVIERTLALEAEKQIVQIQNHEINTLNLDLERRVRKAVTELNERDILLGLQVREAEMGRMMSFITHQWRQNIFAISLYLENLRSSLAKAGSLDHAAADEPLRGIQKFVEIMSKTISDFKAFIDPAKQEVLYMPGDVLEETLELMKDILNSKAIRVIKNIESSHPVEGFPNEFKQVLINLITNSQEVLLDRRVDDPWILFRLHESGGKLFLSVTDNGGGIEKDEYEKIFERNFTTKANGSGLGLYMSRLVIEKHWGGTLEFRPGEDGAIFEITLTPVFP